VIGGGKPRVELGNLRYSKENGYGTDFGEEELCNLNERGSRRIDAWDEGRRKLGKQNRIETEFEMGVEIEVERNGME